MVKSCSSQPSSLYNTTRSWKYLITSCGYLIFRVSLRIISVTCLSHFHLTRWYSSPFGFLKDPRISDGSSPRPSPWVPWNTQEYMTTVYWRKHASAKFYCATLGKRPKYSNISKSVEFWVLSKNSSKSMTALRPTVWGVSITERQMLLPNSKVETASPKLPVCSIISSWWWKFYCRTYTSNAYEVQFLCVLPWWHPVSVKTYPSDLLNMDSRTRLHACEGCFLPGSLQVVEAQHPHLAISICPLHRR